ncbi:MAG TPA: hypothetical protein VHY18_10685 [Solirubrobacteraceae bacterium]|jgi:hypothetical protein|nr:hypothetical protein [Solirubrobacteraceae bacterium]
MLPERATTADYNAIINTLDEYWGERDMRARHHPMFIHEFGETALVMRDRSGSVAAYLFGFRRADPSWVRAPRWRARRFAASRFRTKALRRV